METLLINYERRRENVGKCSTESTLIKPLIGVGSSTSVHLVSGTNLNNNHIFNGGNKHQLIHQQGSSSSSLSSTTTTTTTTTNCNGINGYNKLLRKSVSLPLEPIIDQRTHSSLSSTLLPADDNNSNRAMIASESASLSTANMLMKNGKSYFDNTATTLTRNTNNNGLSDYRGCYSASSTPIKSISPGQLFNTSNSLLTCSPIKLSSTETTSTSQPATSTSTPTTTTTSTTTSTAITNDESVFHSRFNEPSSPMSTSTSSTTTIANHDNNSVSNTSSFSSRSMTSDHLSVSYLSDNNYIDSGPKSLPAFSSNLSSPSSSSGTSSTSLLNKESLYSGLGSIDDGLLTHNGSIVWDRESDWILLFDEMLKLKGTNRQGSEDCICRRKYSDSLRIKASQGISSPSALTSSPASSLSPYNDSDNMMNTSKSSPLKRAASLPPSRRGVSPNIRMTSQIASHSPGAADEEMFIKSFEDVPVVHFSSIKELEDELNRIKEWCGEKNTDWTKRIDGLKRLRSVLMSSSTDMKEFLEWFKGLELSFIPCVKDLRSQVVRETCFTIAYISQKVGLKATRFCETLLPILISLIPNSAKIMSSSATVAIRFIIQYTRSPRLLPVITYNMNSKSKEIRKACCEFLDQILHTWSTPSLERHGSALQEAIKKGISDADPEARQFARKAFWGFADHFRDSADALLHSLDPSKQRILHGEAAYQQSQQSPSSSSSSPHHIGVGLSRNGSRSNSGSTGSLSQTDGPINDNVSSRVSSFLLSSTPPIRKISTGSVSSSSSSSSHTKVPVTKSSTDIPVRSVNSTNHQQPTSYLPRIRCNLNNSRFTSGSLSSSPSSTTSSSSSGSPGSYLSPGSTLRSSSAIDTDAARRARTRAAAISSTISTRGNKNPLTNGSNDINARKRMAVSSVKNTKEVRTNSSDNRQNRYPVRSSQSQPNSRSASPLSRSLVNGSTSTPESRPIRVRRNSGIPVSTNSRETSPTRSTKQSNGLSSSFTNGTNGHLNGHFTRSLSSDSYNLQRKSLKSNNKETDTGNTLKNLNNGQRNRFIQHQDDQSDESDTSSVCSDFSFAARNIEEVSDIICNLSSSQWLDRKEGLLDLNLFLQLGPRSLNQFELKRITEIFNKMLMDPHIKNHSLLFKVLNNLITSHKNHLYDWLYLLMTRLFIKVGSTTLTSLIAKINKTLDTIFTSFPVDNQFSCIARFLSDQSQTLNEKSKLCLIGYINRLIVKMVPVDCYSPDKHDLQLSLMKLISWTSDPKSSELRRQSKEALINLFTLNRQRIYTIVYQLPKTYQDTAFTLIHSRKRPSDDKSCFTSSAVLAPSASLLQDSSMFMSLNIRNGSTFESTFDETENLNPDEVYHSLLRTTDEIQKYKFNGGVDDDLDDRLTSSLIYNRKPSSFASAPSSSPSSPSSSSSKTPSTSSKSNNDNNMNVVSASSLINGSKSKSLASKSTISRSADKKPSDISFDKRNSNNNYINGYHRQIQNGTENNIVKNHLITPLTVDTKASSMTVIRSDETTFNNRSNQSTSSNISNGHHHNSKHYNHINHNHNYLNHNQNHHHHINGHSSPARNGHETITSNLISSLKNGHSKDNDYQKYALNELIELVKDSQLDLSRHFRDMLKILLDKMTDEGNPTVRQLALRILRELLLKQPSLFSDYTELTVLRILSASKDPDKEVQRISDLVSATAASVLPADSCLKILKSAMNSGDGAMSQAAIKMLSKFIERQDEDQIETLLPDIIPSLIQACDNRESSIRKSAIFTLVAIHNRIGDRLNPHIANLNGSKLKLLKLYIEKAQASGTNGSEYSFS